MVDLVHRGRTCARGRVHLYKAPFAPSVRYIQGEERFLLPAGWAVLRSRHGLLAWLELVDDIVLQNVASEVAGEPSPMTGGSPDAALSAIANSLICQLPASTGGVFGQACVRCPYAVAVDAPILVPCEDVVVLHPRGSEGR